MSLMTIVLLAIDLVCTVLGIVSMCLAIAYCTVGKMRYFITLSISIFLISISHLYEMTAQSVGAVVVAYKLYYWGLPLMVIFMFLFSIDYSGLKRPDALAQILLYSIGLFFIISVQLYPHVTLIHKDISLVSGEEIGRASCRERV